MIRTPDVPTRSKKEFDPEEFEKEKKWLERKSMGKIVSSTTDGGWLLYITTALLVAFIIGGSIGALLAAFLMTFPSLLLPPLIVFLIALYFFSGDFAKVELDPEENKIFYEGAVSFAGEYRSIRYRGTIEVIEGVQLVRFKQLLGRSKPFLRMITRSGYLRINYHPETEQEFLQALVAMELIDLSKAKTGLEHAPIKETEKAFIYYEEKFDRKDYFEKLQKEREEEQREKEVQRRIKRQAVLNNSTEQAGQSNKVEMEEESNKK